MTDIVLLQRGWGPILVTSLIKGPFLSLNFFAAYNYSNLQVRDKMLDVLRLESSDGLSESAVFQRTSNCATYKNKFRQILKPKYKFNDYENLEENFVKLDANNKGYVFSIQTIKL